MAALNRGADGARFRSSPSSLAALALLLALAAAIQYPDALRVPFINDDYVFLEKTRGASFVDLWGLRGLTFHWWRPWSREFHYWWLQRAFGAREAPFHVASAVLLLATWLAFHGWARRVAGASAGAIAVAGLAAMGAWAVPVLWIAGVQELWFLLLALLALHAVAARRTTLSVLAFALALLSKETAAVVPAVLALYAWTIERDRPRAALARVLPHAVVLVGWAPLHPALGGRFWQPAAAAENAPGVPLGAAVFRSVASLANLDLVPRPDRAAGVLARGLGAGLALAALVLLAGRAPAARESDGARGAVSNADGEPADPRRVLAFAAGWAALGWLPGIVLRVGWHAYYALFGAMGAWLALGVLLARRPRAAAALIAGIAVLGAAAARTPSIDWGSAWYQRRAGSFLAYMRDDLLRKHPRPAPRERLFFTGVPSNVGFLTTGGPAVRVWYADTTLAAAFWSGYAPRPAGAPPGPDRFFRYDSTAGWVAIATGVEDVAGARAANPRWEADHRDLAGTLARAEDWKAAAAEYEKLAGANPADPEYALDAGICHETLGDSASAGRWYSQALASPRLSEADRSFARRFELRLHPDRQVVTN